MSILLPLCGFALFLAAGLLLARAVLPGEDGFVHAVLSAVFGIGLLAALPALFALALGFRLAAVVAALGICLALCVFLWYRRSKCGSTVMQRSSCKAMLPRLCCVVPVLLFSAFLLYTHTLRPDAAGNLLVGQSTFGDLPMHLSFITSIAENGVFPPVYPLLAGDVPMGYPFLCETVSSALLLLGAPLRLTVMLPQLAALFGVFGGAFLLFEQMLRSAAKAVGAFVLFFLGSGFGFCYFLGDRENFTRIFTAFYETPTNYVQENIVWVNPIADLLIPQRATLFGYCILFSTLYLLWRFAFRGEARLWLPLALLGGILPMLHTHSFLALVVVSAVLLIRAVVLGARGKALHPWGAYAGLAALLSLPQLLCFTFGQAAAEGFLRFGFNWVNETDGFLWFYIKNIGLVFLLLLPAWLHAGRNLRWFYGGGLALWALCELIIFQPNPYDNNKLLYVWHLLGCALVANLVFDLLAKLRRTGLRAVIGGIFFFFATIGSLLTLGREAVSSYVVFGAAEVQAAAFAQENLPADTLILTANQHNNALAALAGRRIFCGSASYLYFHGIAYQQKEAMLPPLYEAPTLAMLRAEGIEYICIGEHERARYDIDFSFYEEETECVYREGGIALYRVPAVS